MRSPRRGPERDDALSVVVEQRHALIAAIRATTGLDEHAAEDVLSLVTVRVLVNGAQTAPESWLRYMREADRSRVTTERRRTAPKIDRETDHLPTLADPPVDAVAARMMWLDAIEDLRALPDLERRVFWLRHYDDMTRAEIAAGTGLSLSSVDVRLRQARHRLVAGRRTREATPAYALVASFGHRFSRAGRPSRQSADADGRATRGVPGRFSSASPRTSQPSSRPAGPAVEGDDRRTAQHKPTTEHHPGRRPAPGKP